MGKSYYGERLESIGARNSQPRSTSWLGSTPKASPILRTVLSRGLVSRPVSRLSMVVGLTPAFLASSRWVKNFSSRKRLSFAPINLILVGIIVVTIGRSFHGSVADLKTILAEISRSVQFGVAELVQDWYHTNHRDKKELRGKSWRTTSKLMSQGETKCSRTFYPNSRLAA